MLRRLSVDNLAIVEKAEAEFAPGLNVLTGETGAGKSVLMGALELVLGGRADSTMVRDGATEARVEAEFELGARETVIATILEELGLPECEDGVLILRRVLSANGGGRVWINDAVSTAASLRKIARSMVEIHGPRANQRLLENEFQLSAVDAFGSVDRAEYNQTWQKLGAVRKELADALGAAKSSEQAESELEFLRYQVDELTEAKIGPGDVDIAQRHAAAAHAAEILSAANRLVDGLTGERGAAETLIRLQSDFTFVAKHLPVAKEWGETAESLILGAQELSRTVEDGVSRIESDPAAFEELDRRLTLINRLKRKYGEDLLAALEKRQAHLDELEHRDERIAELRNAESEAVEVASAMAARLTKHRRDAAKKISSAITRQLHDLGFLKAKLSVELEKAELCSTGCDCVKFMFEPNPGESARELKDIASSGEIARVMLAVKAVLASHDDVDVMVFDEVDANVGGEIGSVVGAKLKAVAEARQVITITHLPQCAVAGDRHLVVSKRVEGGRTRTKVCEVNGEARIAEIVRMLGGDGKTGVVRKHAEELLGISG